MLSRNVLVLLMCLAIVPVAADEFRNGAQADARVRTVAYERDHVYDLFGYAGYAIHIELEPGEQYRGLGAGDSEALTVDVHDHHVFLKPRALPVATNLTLLTDRRRYLFEYRADATSSIPTAEHPLIFSLRFEYPSAPENGTASIEKALADVPATIHRPTNVDYWYCGHRSLKPLAAYDDGVHTRIRFSSRSEMPVILVRNEDDTESLLNYSVQGGEVVIHRLAPALVLRRGRIVGCIVNRGYAGSGERLPSGTVAPSVQRQIRGARP